MRLRRKDKVALEVIDAEPPDPAMDAEVVLATHAAVGREGFLRQEPGKTPGNGIGHTQEPGCLHNEPGILGLEPGKNIAGARSYHPDIVLSRLLYIIL